LIAFPEGADGAWLAFAAFDEVHCQTEELVGWDRCQRLAVDPVNDQRVGTADPCHAVVSIRLLRHLAGRQIQNLAAVQLAFTIKPAEIIRERLAKRCHFGALGQHDARHLAPVSLVRVERANLLALRHFLLLRFPG
jgi:hypothetical protein